jgi:hypothetical protein
MGGFESRSRLERRGRRVRGARVVVVKDRHLVEPTDLPCFGQPAVLAWRKTRFGCVAGYGLFTERGPRSLPGRSGSRTGRRGRQRCGSGGMAGWWVRWLRVWGAGRGRLRAGH